MFLATLNLPASDGPEFLFWVEKIPISDEDIITICLTFMAAGLDTTRAALG
jgi:cytochrome P450